MLIFSNHVAQEFDKLVERLNPSSIYLLADSNTATLVMPKLQAESAATANATVIRVTAGEDNKSLDTVNEIWNRLSQGGATRSALLVNVGGGVITDMGGFAASTFKRGIRFVNIPTTLLAAVDASVGGKCGINFNELKNEIGVIKQADFTIISTTYFGTLTTHDMLSGYAEMLKHAMLSSSEMLGRLLAYDITAYDPDTLLKLLHESVDVKCKYVDADLNDYGLRHALNFGHTVGHAFEMLALQRKSPIAHGYAVAFGMVAALVLSRMKEGFPSDVMHNFAAYVEKNYGVFAITCDDYPSLLQMMHHDKKNTATDGDVNFVLLKDVGDPVIDVPVSDDDISAALDIYRDLMHI